MRPTCERPTMDNRSNSSKVPVAFANARRSRSRSTPSGRFISKTGSRPKGTLHDSSLNGQQVEFVEGPGGFRKRKAEPLPQYAFGQVHLENRKQAEGHAPRLKPQWTTGRIRRRSRWLSQTQGGAAPAVRLRAGSSRKPEAGRRARSTTQASTDNRSNSSKVPVAFANARRSRSRSTPSGRFISKTGSRPKGTLHDSSLNGTVTEN